MDSFHPFASAAKRAWPNSTVLSTGSPPPNEGETSRCPQDWNLLVPATRTPAHSGANADATGRNLHRQHSQTRKWGCQSQCNTRHPTKRCPKTCNQSVYRRCSTGFINGEPMKRELDLIDVWFDSGSMPHAQWHYPLKPGQDRQRPFIPGLHRRRRGTKRDGFIPSTPIATMVFDSVAYKNVILNGLVLDKNGVKMSKRLGNVRSVWHHPAPTAPMLPVGTWSCTPGTTSSLIAGVKK